MECDICLHRCELEAGEIGKCKVFVNENGRIVNKYSEIVSGIAVESISKRPFYHFGKGLYLTVGLWGCNFHCQFCQNFSISQSFEGEKKTVTPPELIKLAIENNAHGIAFSYNEPTIHYDYIVKTGRMKGDLKLVVKTNGFFTTNILSQMLPWVDAYNIDIKGDDNVYRLIGGGYLCDIVHNVNHLVSMGKHIEISYLVHPSTVDNLSFHEKLRDILPPVPIHLLYCYPVYDTEYYDKHRLIDLHSFFSKKFEHVYISNIYSEEFLPFRQDF